MSNNENLYKLCELESSVYSCLNKYSLLKDKTTLAILYSAGSDSSTLLHALSTIKHKIKAQDNIDIDIVIIHINYNLRGADSIADRDFATSKAYKLGFKIFIKNIDKSIFDSGNLQKKARDIRYQYAKELHKEKIFDALLVAHNKNDYIETVLYKLIKGTSTRLPYCFKERVGYIVRPMLNVSKDEINVYIKSNNIEYHLDKSNEKNKYSRNKIRNLVLPVLDSISNNSMDNIIDFLTLMKQELKPLEKRTRLYCKKHMKVNIKDSKNSRQNYLLDIEHITRLDKIIIFRIIAKFVSKSSDIRISKKIIKEIYKIIISKKPNISIIIQGYTLEKSYNILSISKSTTNKIKHSEKIVVEKEGLYNFYGKNILVSIVNKDNIDLKDGSIYIDIKLPFIIRSRKEADSINIYPNGHKKLLRKIFIDAKIPIKIREKIPIIEYNNEIAAVMMKSYSDKPNRISYEYSISELSSSNIIKIEIEAN